MTVPVDDYIAICLERSHLVRTMAIAVVVGTWLTIVNQGDVVLAGNTSLGVWVKIFLNYLTPFVVSNWGLISRQSKHDSREQSGG